MFGLHFYLIFTRDVLFSIFSKMGKSKKKGLRSCVDKPYANLADQITGDQIVSRKNKEPKIRLRQDDSEEVINISIYYCNIDLNMF